MKNKLRILVALLFFFFTTQSLSSPISKINFSGLNNAPEESLLKIIPFKAGQELNNSLSNEIISSLFETGLFSDISIIVNNNNLEITLVENPTIKIFDVNLDSESGFSSWLKGEKLLLSQENLAEELAKYELSPGDIYTQEKLNSFITFLESKYLDLGYYDFKISKKISTDSQNRAEIILSVNQGDRAKINSFNISGSQEFSEEDLLDLFKIGEADMAIVNYFTNKDLFIAAEFSKGIDLMTNAYFNKGYLDFKIINLETKLNDSKKEISINIEISEGIQYKLGKVSFEGQLAPFSISDLEMIVSIKEGDIFNRNLVIENIQKLTDKYADKGFAFININPVTSEFLDIVNIKFDISTNSKVYINRISISGNTRTQDSVIRREIGISEGALYSRNLLKDSLLKLRRLGYFSDVQISTSEVSEMPDKIDIYFDVEETQTGSLSFSMSHSNNYGISLGAGIEEKNIFGSGNTLNANFKISESFNKLSFYFMNPNYNDSGHSLSFGAFKSEINDDDVAENSYNIDSTGLSAGYGIPLTKDTRLNGELIYSKNKIKCSELFSGSNYEEAQCKTNNKNELTASLSWNKNTLNSYLYPTEGQNHSLYTQVSLPGSDTKFFNINGSYTHYTPVNNSATIKIDGSLNFSKGFGGKALPFYKRHFGGGSGSIRGFGNKTLGPVYPNGKAKGGELSVLGSANIIGPALFFEKNEKMRMSAFIDTGNVFEKTGSLKLRDLRMSAGIGYAYLSPIGTIGAYLAVPILKKTGDITEDFGFSLGTGF